MTPPDTLPDFLNAAWTMLGRGTADAKAAANRPTLATAGPELRTVVLRAADRGQGTLDIHSDARAGKIAQISADTNVALHVWDAKANLQIRMRGAAILHIDDAEAQSAFDALPEHGQAIYRIAPDPGVPLTDPDATSQTGPARFALIRITLREIELLHLARARHSRALYTRAEEWRGTWLVP